MEMASSEVEISSCQSFNCVLSPHERCLRGDNNKKKNQNNNNNNVRNIHVAFEKNLNVFVRDHLENCSVSGENVDGSTKTVPDSSSVSDHRLSKTEESRHEEEVPSSSSLGSDPDLNLPISGQPGKNSSRNETMAASSLVQIWEARTTQQPPSSNQNQSQIDSRTSSSGSNVLENSESLNEESELIQTIEEGNNEEEEEEEEMECDSQIVPPPPDSGEKEREGVRVMDIIRKLSTDSETMANNDNGSSSNDNAKEAQTTEARCFPQVACSPRIRGRQAFAELLVQMTRDREKELACLSERHSVSKFTHRGRIQSTLRIRCYERCIAIQDRNRSRPSSSGSDLNRSPRGSGVMHLLREKYKTNSDNAETGASSSSVSSRGRLLDKDPRKATEKKEAIEKSDSVVEIAKKAVSSENAENKSGLRKSAGETVQKETAQGSCEKRETKEKAIAKETTRKAKETTKGRGEKQEMKEKAIPKESIKGNALVGIAEKVNLWNSEEKMNMGRGMEKGKAESKANIVRVEKDILEEASRRISDVESAERSIITSKEMMTPRCEFGEKVVRGKNKEDCVSVETKSKEIEVRNRSPQEVTSKSDNFLRKPATEEKVLQETTVKSDLSKTSDSKNGLKKPVEKESREGRGEKREVEESVEENTLMGIAEKVNLWNSKEKKNRRRFMEKGKGKTEGKANTETNQVLQEASRRITNVETAERSITTSKETVEKVVENNEMMDTKQSSSRELSTQCETEEKERRKKEEDFGSVEAKSQKDIVEVKCVNPQDVLPAEETVSHISRERAKEIDSSQHSGEMSILRKPEAKSTRTEEESASDASRERTTDKNSLQQDEEMSILPNSNDGNGTKDLEDEETKKEEHKVEETAMEFVNDWDEDEMEDLEEEEYGDYDHYNGENSYDWINDISRPRSYWEELRKERYLEVLNTESEKKDICNLIESRTVSNFLTSDLRQKIDNLMITRVQSHLGVPINQKQEYDDDDDDEEEEEEEWVEECSARNQEDKETEEEPEKTNLEAASDGCSQSSARSSTLLMSWSFRDQDIDKDYEPTTSLSLPEPSVQTDQSTQEMQMISDLKVQMEKLQREMLELRNTVKSCVDMQLHFQKSVTQDLSRSGSSGEQRVDTKKDPLKRKCCVCLEMPVDSLLYRCGHMCTCLKCAHELQWSSKKCPICMAPIVDVVRAFLDS
ncbi:intracellular protein transport protein USO1 [Eutrema salsugineum]|uniref:intracellular protein transport protein USO1 n=1 Tax=Eutrema salsugineum TaxID=72664 RepID=UPI000CED6739|nr:intracellular protein transport protein USO1 [Eutrema salsugineum]